MNFNRFLKEKNKESYIKVLNYWKLAIKKKILKIIKVKGYLICRRIKMRMFVKVWKLEDSIMVVLKFWKLVNLI